MLEVILTYPTDEGSLAELALGEGKVSFGRGSEADHRFDDDGLSRLHATVYREGENVWMTDENSTNGSFVNGEKIKIGHYTTLTVKIGAAQAAQTQNPSEKSKTVAASGAESNGIPVLI